jgi:FMN phosphatase YigB (HAD superfamily)/tetratricopeptide (TPR) repeat protein/glycosyltransferase involved in cell wall biosynthesis
MKTLAAFLTDLDKRSEATRTVVRLLAALARNGFDCHLHVEGRKPAGDLSRLRDELKELAPGASLTAHAGWNAAAGHDLWLATNWASALALAARDGGAAKKIYFAQDYEPHLHPMGGRHVLAEHALLEGLEVVASGRWLAEKLRRDFDLAARVVEIGADTTVFQPRGNQTTKEFAIAAVFDPENPRSAPGTCLSALQLLQKILPHLVIHTFGGATAPAGLRARHHAGAPPARLNELFNRCLAGVSLSLTRPARSTFELMAAGLPVVEAHRENTRYDLPEDGVVCVEPKPEAIKDAVLELIANASRRHAVARAAAVFMKDRTARQEEEQFCQHVADVLAGRPARRVNLSPSKSPPARRAGGAPAGTTFDLVTVDVWDTLLRRRCHPDEIKLFTARRLELACHELLKPAFDNAAALVKERVRCELALGQQRKRAGLDDEYAIREVFHLWITSVLARRLAPPELDELADRLVSLEVQQEMRCLYPDAGITALLEGIPARRRLFVSDFYLPATHVKSLLAHAGLDRLVPDGVVSCDASLHKRSGRLFKKVQQDTGVAPARHLHIGDNEYSDHFIPQTLGIRSHHYLCKTEAPKLERFHEEHRQRDGRAGFVPAELRRRSRLKPGELDRLETKEAMFRLGEAAAPLFAGFALFLAEEAVKRRLPRLHFFTREGDFFAKVYAALGSADPLGVPFPEPVLLEVSRLATFAASLKRFDAAEFMRMWNLYSSQSLRGFFTSLDLDPAPFADVIRRCGLALDELIRYPWSDARVQKLLATGPFTQALAAAGAAKRALLLDYLKARGVTPETGEIGIVDIGWRGTIQDNLAGVLDRTKIHGWYFGLLPFLNPQPPNVTKSAFGPGLPGDSEAVRRLLEFVSPLEMLCNSEAGSTLRYERRDGTVVAQREENERERRVFSSHTRHFQDGVLSRIGEVAEQIRLRAISPAELRPFGLELLAQIVHDPPRAAAEAYFELNHNETFGLGGFDDKQRHRTELATITALYDAGELDAFAERLKATTWPQGFAALCGIRFPFFRGAPMEPPPLPPAERQAARLLAGRAAEHYRAGRFEEAGRLALEALKTDPWRLNVHYLAYRACLQQGRTRAALQHARLIRALHPKHAPTLNEFARGSHLSGLGENAVKVLETLVEEQPSYRPGVLNLCRVRLREGRAIEALALLEKHRQHFGEDPEFLRFHTLASLYAGSAIMAGAREKWGRLAGNDSIRKPGGQEVGKQNSWTPGLLMGVSDLPEFEEFTALAADDECLAASAATASQPGATTDAAAPETVEPVEAVLQQATADLNARRDAAALERLDRLTALRPDLGRAHFGRAVALTRLGRHAEAREAVMKLPPSDRRKGRAALLLAELETAVIARS